MSHLGERVTALVDGELSAVESERAYAHAAGCRPCRDEIESERLMKARLCAMTDCGPSPDLLLNLFTMAAPGGPVRPRESHMPGMPWATPVSIGAPAGSFPAGSPLPLAASVALPVAMPATAAVAPAGTRRPVGRTEPTVRPTGRSESTRTWLSGRNASQRRLAMAVIGAVGAVGVGAVGVGAGTASSSAPRVVPQVDHLVVQHAATTQNLPFSDTGATWQVLWSSGGTGR
jgi:hypothetical protein